MSENKIRILEATLETVSRYGVRKTSVGDIAKQSGLSRQTIYNLFETRDDIFRAAIAYAGEVSRARLRKNLTTLNTLSDQLDAMFEEFVIAGYKYTRRSPDAHDITTSAHEIAHDVLQTSFEANAALIAEMLKPYHDQLKARGFSRTRLAAMIEMAGRGYKRDATSLSQLKALLENQKQLILMATA